MSGGAPAAEPLDVLVVDDHALVRSGMRRLLEDHGLVATVAEASSGEEAIELVRARRFGLVLMDIALPGISGVEASERLLAVRPDTRIVMISGRLDRGPIRRLLASGVRGYVTKGSEVEEMDRAIRRVVAGERYLSPDVARELAMGTLDGASDDPFARLSGREHQVVLLLLRGRRNREIADSLHISEKTVSTHRTRAFEKIGVANTAELVRLAMRHGLWDEEGG